MYRWVEHTAELELRVEAESREGVFADALAAFSELVADELPGTPAQHEIELRAPDPALLLVVWLEELVFLAETASFVPESVLALALDGDGELRATVAGHEGSPSHLVKAVTLHNLAFAATDGRWQARLVLDV